MVEVTESAGILHLGSAGESSAVGPQPTMPPSLMIMLRPSTPSSDESPYLNGTYQSGGTMIQYKHFPSAKQFPPLRMMDGYDLV